MVLFYILFLSKTMRLYPLKMSWKSLCLSLRNLWYQFRLGLSAFLGEISISILIFVGNYVFMKYLGEDGVAAFSIACYIMPFIFMTGNAISQSAQPIISFNHGAGNRNRVLEARKFSLLTAFTLGIVVSLALAFGISYVAALFLSKDAPAYSIAAHGVPLMAIGFTLSIVNVAAIGYYQSVERALPATIFSLSRGVIFLVPCFLVIPLFCRCERNLARSAGDRGADIPFDCLFQSFQEAPDRKAVNLYSLNILPLIPIFCVHLQNKRTSLCLT